MKILRKKLDFILHEVVSKIQNRKNNIYNIP